MLRFVVAAGKTINRRRTRMSCLTKHDIEAALDSGDLAVMRQNEAGDWYFVGRSEDKEDELGLVVGPNSIDLHLHPDLKVYRNSTTTEWSEIHQLHYERPATPQVPLDARGDLGTEVVEISEEGYILMPGVLYLARTVERTITPLHVPKIGGRSSTGRLGINIHQTAGFGDVGFDGTWTLELSVIHPVRVYPNMRIAQLWLFEASSPLAEEHRYGGAHHGGRYQGQVDPTEYRGNR